MGLPDISIPESFYDGNDVARDSELAAAIAPLTAITDTITSGKGDATDYPSLAPGQLLIITSGDGITVYVASAADAAALHWLELFSNVED